MLPLIPPTDAKLSGKLCTRLAFACCISSSLGGRGAANVAQLLHELDQRAVVLRGHDVAAGAERTGPRPNAKLELTP